MASDTTTAEPKAEYRIMAADFDYTHGEWRKPSVFNDTAGLLHGNKVVATALFNTERLQDNFISVSFAIGKAEENSGWNNGDLHILAEMADKSATKSINAQYLMLPPNMGPSHFHVTFRVPTGTTDKELRVTLVDETEHPKSGLVLYHVSIIDA